MNSQEYRKLALEAESMKYQYEFFLGSRSIKTITGDIYDAERTADEIAEKLGVDVDDLIIAVIGRMVNHELASGIRTN